MTVKIGLLSAAHMHAASYAVSLNKLPGVEFAGVADEDAARGRAFAERFCVPFFDDAEALLALDGLDGVVICSENARHKPLTRLAAAAKKHVLCEKPISTNAADARDMIAACRSNGVQLMTAFPVRFNTPVLRAKKILQDGEIGRIVSIQGNNRGLMPGGWFVEPELSGGGAVIDHTVHVADLMRWVSGREFVEVYAEIDTLLHDVPTDDVGILTMELEGGLFGSLDASWSKPVASYPTWGDVHMRWVGTEGLLDVDAIAQAACRYSEHGKPVEWLPWADDMDEALIADFADMIATGREASVTGEDGLRALEVALAAYESARRGRPVRIEEIAGPVE